MGVLVKTMTGARQTRQLNWFGRGMNRVRKWEDAHPGWSKLEAAPTVLGPAVLAFADAPAGAAICAAAALTGNVVLRLTAFRARRTALESDLKTLRGLPQKERFKYAWAILRDRKASIKIKTSAARVLAESRAPEHFNRMLWLMKEQKEEQLEGPIFAALCKMYGRVETKQNLGKNTRGYFEAEYVHADRLEDLLRRHEKSLARLGPDAAPFLKEAIQSRRADNMRLADILDLLGRVGSKTAFGEMSLFFQEIQKTLLDMAPLAATGRQLSEMVAKIRKGRNAAAEAIGKFKIREAVPALLEALDPGPDIALIEALGKTGDPSAAPRLIELLDEVAPSFERQKELFSTLAEALAKIGAPEATAALEKRRADPSLSSPARAVLASALKFAPAPRRR